MGKNQKLSRQHKFIENTSFVIELSERDLSGYHASVAVSAKATTIDKVVELVDEYRKYNDLFLKNKVKEIIGDDGNVYFDRK